MNERLVNRIPFARIVTVLAIVFGISLGLCGLTFVISSGGNIGGDSLFTLGMLELAALVGSATGLVLTLVVFVTLAVIGRFSKKVSQSENLTEEENDTKIDKNE